MKNIHILPTDKPSRLFKSFGKLNIGDYITSREDLQVTNQNIYITSDEAIFIENWVIANNGLLAKVTTEFTWHFINSKKIILTTDQDLIADGVQSIDDEFLQWFVKNPSCESVEVEKRYSDFTVNPFVGYKIIIPKEEPKQDTISEAAEKRIPTSPKVWDLTETRRSDFKAGAKWQQERMYSEEEVRKAIQETITLMRYKANESIYKVSLDYLVDNLKKIILTTDQDLIDDGVQAIDDEFLEWFVKNPSCEKVKVEDFPMTEKYNSKGEYVHRSYWVYKIIIPKEEPKQETLEGLISEYHSIAYEKLIKELTEQETFKNYPVIIVRNDDKEEFIHLSNGMYRTKWGILHDSISSTPLESFDKSKFTFYYE
jgi:hypothetical protein